MDPLEFRKPGIGRGVPHVPNPLVVALGLGEEKRITLIPFGSSKQSQVRNLVQFRVALASTSFMHKHFPREQTFPCGTNHASRACQQRTKTERKECTRLQTQKAHTLASLGKLCTKAPTGWGEKREHCQCLPRHARGPGEGARGLRRFARVPGTSLL